MSILVCEILPIGVVFAADKNVTITKLDGQGNIASEAQDQGSKILRWPRNKALLGYVGCATVGNKTMYDWLYDFIGDHITFEDPEVVANDMRDRLQTEIGGRGASSSIIQFATFTTRDGFVVPEFWHVTNVHNMTNGEYDPPTETFIASERLLGVHLRGHATPANVRTYLEGCAQRFQPFWFHQGFGLAGRKGDGALLTDAFSKTWSPKALVRTTEPPPASSARKPPKPAAASVSNKGRRWAKAKAVRPTRTPARSRTTG